MTSITRHMTAVTLIALVTLAGCRGGGGGGSGSTDPTTSTSCSTSGAPFANQTRLDCGMVLGDTVTVNAVIGGLSTSTDIASVLFDLTFDDTLFEFVAGSVVEGNLLSPAGPTILSATLSATDPGRVIVSIALQGGAGGVQAPAGETLILSLEFRSLGVPGGDMPSFANAEVLDSGGMTIAGIAFSNNLMLTTL